MYVKMSRDDSLRELVHKSWHRGCKETDILLGYFAREKLNKMNDDFLTLYKKFIQEPDWDIYAWLTEERSCPEDYLTIVEAIISYHKNLHSKN